MSYVPMRINHCKLLEMVDEGILDPKDVLEAALGWMDDKEVERMAYANEFFIDSDDEDDGQPDEMQEWESFDPDA
jgi:hypothetical protein